MHWSTSASEISLGHELFTKVLQRVEATLSLLPITSEESDWTPSEVGKAIARGAKDPVAGPYGTRKADDICEAFICFHMLLSDLSALRKELRWVWEAYRAQQLSLDAVSLTTNVIIATAEQLENEAKEAFEYLPDPRNTCRGLLEVFCQVRGIVPEAGEAGVKLDTGFFLEKVIGCSLGSE